MIQTHRRMMKSKTKKLDRFNSKGKKHEDKISWTSLVAAEVANIKKSQLNYSSRYYRRKTAWDFATQKCGFEYSLHSEIERLGSQEEWLEGYRYFCRQEVNTKGKKVNRKHLLDICYNKS